VLVLLVVYFSAGIPFAELLLGTGWAGGFRAVTECPVQQDRGADDQRPENRLETSMAAIPQPPMP
jgi:hypothetical protein